MTKGHYARGILEGAAKLYANGQDLKSPMISPAYGDFEGFPPTYLVTGTRSMPYSCSTHVLMDMVSVKPSAHM